MYLIMDKFFKFKNFVDSLYVDSLGKIKLKIQEKDHTNLYDPISTFFEESILEDTVEILGTVTYDFSFLCKAQ